MGELIRTLDDEAEFNVGLEDDGRVWMGLTEDLSSEITTESLWYFKAENARKLALEIFRLVGKSQDIEGK